MSGKVPETLSRVQFGGSPVGATGVRRGNGVRSEHVTLDRLSRFTQDAFLVSRRGTKEEKGDSGVTSRQTIVGVFCMSSAGPLGWLAYSRTRMTSDRGIRR